MSDFIFAKRQRHRGELTQQIKRIYHEDSPAILEYHGDWGSLAVSRNLHMGFDPVETDTHLCIIIGGPVLTFTSNRFLTGNDPSYGTRQILIKWLSNEGIVWDTDLSGPFVALKIAKAHGQLEIISDLMSFIPVYQTEESKNKVIGTHVDMVARVANCGDRRDRASLADFILHGVITYPYTLYPPIKQIPPASVHKFSQTTRTLLETRPYWLPKEKTDHFHALDEAASKLIEGLQAYGKAVTEGMDRVALFLSGGEDSRVVLGMVSQFCDCDAFIFLDHMNREGRVAEAAARAYGSLLRMYPRAELRYLNVLPACADLVGTGSEYTHVHSYGLDKTAALKNYPAVFGGFFSDSYLKGMLIRRRSPLNRFPFLPQLKDCNFTRKLPSYSPVFSEALLFQIQERRLAHYNNLRSLRPHTADEWFELWPSSMDNMLPHLSGNRRLFRSYEPFMSNVAIKVSSASPQSWKLNRRLFQKMAKPFLRKSRNLLHADGWMPYYPWYANVVVHGSVWTWRRIQSKLGPNNGNQGPWNDWHVILKSEAWANAIATFSKRAQLPRGVFTMPLEQLFDENWLSTLQKVNLMQVLYQCGDIKQDV